MTLLEPYNLPFAIAIMLLLFVALAQIIGMGDMLDGADADFDIDVDVELETPDGLASGGIFESALSLFGLGRVPFLIWLVVLLFVFAGIGVAGQQLSISLLGSPFHPGLAALAAGAVALPLNGLLMRPLARLLPQDETSVVHISSLVRRDAEIQTGTARRGSPARAKVIDRHGHPHFVMVEPHDPDATLDQGETVLLVRREGETFYAVQYENPLLGLQ